MNFDCDVYFVLGGLALVRRRAPNRTLHSMSIEHKHMDMRSVRVSVSAQYPCSIYAFTSKTYRFFRCCFRWLQLLLTASLPLWCQTSINKYFKYFFFAFHMWHISLFFIFIYRIFLLPSPIVCLSYTRNIHTRTHSHCFSSHLLCWNGRPPEYQRWKRKSMTRWRCRRLRERACVCVSTRNQWSGCRNVSWSWPRWPSAGVQLKSRSFLQ